MIILTRTKTSYEIFAENLYKVTKAPQKSLRIHANNVVNKFGNLWEFVAKSDE